MVYDVRIRIPKIDSHHIYRWRRQGKEVKKINPYKKIEKRKPIEICSHRLNYTFNSMDPAFLSLPMYSYG